VQRRLAGVLRAIEDGTWSDALRTRLSELEQSKTTLAWRPKELDAPLPARLPPNAAALYRDRVATLQATLAGNDIAPEAADALRELIDEVVLTPDDASPDRLRADLHGDLAMILGLATSQPALGKASCSDSGHGPGTDVPGNLLSVVAGTEFADS